MVGVEQNWNPNNMNLVAIIAIGRSSSLFFQGLLDGHPEIATLPTFDYLPTCLRKIIKEKKLPEDRRESVISEVIAWGRRVFGKETEGAPDINQEKFQEKFLEYIEEFGYSRKAVFIAVYYAFSSCLSKDIGRIRMIVFQCHLGGRALPPLDDFESAKFIGNVRDPRASLAGPLSKGSYNIFSWGLFPSSQFRFLKTMWFSGYPVLFIKHEDLHTNSEETMRKLASFLDISYEDSLDESTYFFSRLRFDGSALASKSSTGFFANKPDPKYAQNRWESVLSPRDTAFVEWANKDLMKEFRYNVGAKPFGVRGLVPNLDVESLTESGFFHKSAKSLNKIPFLGNFVLYVGLGWYLREALYNIVITESISIIIRLKRATHPRYRT